MSKICGIYRIKSPSNKIYIGSSKDILYRLSYYKRLQGCKNQTKLYNSFQKYGVLLHKFEIVEECSFEDLYIKERYWQEYYKSVETGLNCLYVDTNEKPRIMSKESREKNSLSNKNKVFSEITKQKLSNARKNRIVLKTTKLKLSIAAKNRSKEHKLKLSYAALNRTKEHQNKISISKSKKVLQFDKNMNFIKEWDSATVAYRALHISNVSIGKCCLNKVKSAGGFIWRLKL